MIFIKDKLFHDLVYMNFSNGSDRLQIKSDETGNVKYLPLADILYETESLTKFVYDLITGRSIVLILILQHPSQH